MISRRLLRIKAMHIAFACFNNNDGDIKFYENELNNSIQKFYDLYIAILFLLVDLRYYAENKLEQRKNKHIATKEDLNPSVKFITNQVLLDIEVMLNQSKTSEVKNFGWNKYPEILKKIYNNLITSDTYLEYMSEDIKSYTRDKQIICDIIEYIFANNDDLYQLFEDMSIYWNDDIELALTMNIRTIQRMKQTKAGENKLLPLFKNKDDQEFVLKLFRKTIVNHTLSTKLIEEASSNWEVERIAKIDKVILEVAMAELITFPLIPIAVTFDEYIEMGKYYSTDRSHTFINGILDRVILKMNEEGLVKKINTPINNKEDETAFSVSQ